jgi:hypothetical protein
VLLRSPCLGEPECLSDLLRPRRALDIHGVAVGVLCSGVGRHMFGLVMAPVERFWVERHASRNVFSGTLPKSALACCCDAVALGQSCECSTTEPVAT